MIEQFPRYESLVKEDNTVTFYGTTFLNEVVNQVNLSEILSGTGTPEGTVPADPKKLYMDENGVAGAILYIKRTGSGDTGWILI